MKYIPALDGLRAVAVLLVIARHWRPPVFHREFGWVGVQVFLVLSGFLICSILLVDKRRLDLGNFLKVFYAKRTLRIFPAYYLFLGLLFAFMALYAAGVPAARFDALDEGVAALDGQHRSLLLYYYNFRDLIAIAEGVATSGSKLISHLWSLSLEEQFYIVFPLLVYFLSRRNLIRVLAATVLLTPLVRFALAETLPALGAGPGQVGLVIYKSTFSQVDSLALGGLLAAVGLANLRASNFALGLVGGSAVALLVATVAVGRSYGVPISYASLGMELPVDQMFYRTGNPLIDYKYTYSLSLINLWAAALVVACARGVSTFSFLANRALVWIGKRSYGIYIYHHPIYVLYFIVVGIFLRPSQYEGSVLAETALLVPYLGIVLGVSYLSYRFFEARFLELKERFQPEPAAESR